MLLNAVQDFIRNLRPWTATAKKNCLAPICFLNLMYATLDFIPHFANFWLRAWNFKVLKSFKTWVHLPLQSAAAIIYYTVPNKQGGRNKRGVWKIYGFSDLSKGYGANIWSKYEFLVASWSNTNYSSWMYLLNFIFLKNCPKISLLKPQKLMSGGRGAY